jgi:hypothetical protein
VTNAWSRIAAVKRAVAAVALSSHLLLALAGPAHAQVPPPSPAPPSAAAPPAAAPPPMEGDAAAARARELKARGDKAIGEMQYTEALAAYDEAYRTDPTWEVLFNRGRAYQFLGRYPEALDDFDRFSREAPPPVRAKVPGIERIVADVRNRVAFLTIRSPVTGATVVLGDRVLGTTPLPPRIGVTAGTVVLKATAPGREASERALILEGGGKEVQIELVLAPTGDGILRIESGTPGAIASVDGRRIGAVPVDVPTSPGEHEVMLERDDYESASQRARADPGKTRLVRFDLVEEPGLHERWWFWTGVGLVVAGGIATAIIVTREKDAPTGDFSPGQVGVAGVPPMLSF